MIDEWVDMNWCGRSDRLLEIPVFAYKNITNRFFPQLFSQLFREIFYSFSPFKILIILTVTLTGCLGDESDFSSLDKQAKDHGGEGIGRCAIKRLSPSNTGVVKVSGLDGNSSTFLVETEGTQCEVKFFLNNQSTPLPSSGGTLQLASNLLNSEGSNLLRVVVSGPIGRDESSWTIVKNQLPQCQLSNPSVPNVNVVQGSAPFTMTVNGTVESGETIQFSWLLNQQSSAFLTKTIEGGGASQYTLNHASLPAGLHEVRILVSDGIDTVACVYNINIGPNCNITGKSPNVSSLKWASQSTVANTLSVTAGHPSCIVSWKINGNVVVGQGLERNFYASELNTGSNIVSAEIVSTSGSTQASWVVVKNSPPSCSQSPAPIGNVNVSVNGTINLSAALSDNDSGDTLTWSWFLNNNPLPQPGVSVTNSTNYSQAAFNPTSEGVNNLRIQVSDGYDVTNCSWTVQVLPACRITSAEPGADAVYVSHFGPVQSMFSVVPANTSCSISWELNGVGLGSGVSKILAASSFPAGQTNTLTVRVSNASSSETKTWTVTRNQLPNCESVSPPQSGHHIKVGNSQNFSTTVVDPDTSGQTVTLHWTLNGLSPGSNFSDNSSGNIASATWTPQAMHVGVNNLSLEVRNFYNSSQYDSRLCSWSTMVLPECSFVEKSPVMASFRVPFSPSHTQTFTAVANHPSCVVSWELNGSSVGNGSIYNLMSQNLNPGANTFKAKLNNAVSNANHAWTVIKNEVHSCSSQSPDSPASVDLGSTQSFVGTFNNPDGDTLTFQWSLSGNNLSGQTSHVLLNFKPNISQLGSNQLLRLTAYDGFDHAFCDWTVTISDPNVAQILSWHPLIDPVVILSNGSQTFSVTAVGTGITYKWYLDNVLLSGRTSASETFHYNQMSPGMHTIKVVVTDAQNNSAEKIFNVKRNRRPTISATAPSLTGILNYRININGSVTANVTASDDDSDPLVYQWTLNNQFSDSFASGTLVHNSNPSLATSASFNPSGNSLFLGMHQLRVTVSDGFESATYMWPISVNYFSESCNSLFNSPPSVSGGKICTLVGNPSLGDGEDVLTDPTRIKIVPNHTIELEPNVYAYADGYYHVVGVVNFSNSSKTYFNKVIPPGRMKVVLGVGQRGRNDDANGWVNAFGVTPEGVSYPNFKLSDPIHLEYAPNIGSGVLFIADRGNNRVLALNQNGQVLRVLGLSGGNTSATANEGNGNAVSCAAPSGLAVNEEGGARFLYTTCNGSHVVRKTSLASFTGTNHPSFNTSIAIGRLQSNGQHTNVDAVDGPGTGAFDPAVGAIARTNAPWGIFTYNGLVFFSDATRRIRIYNPTNSTINFYPAFSSQLDKFYSDGLQFSAKLLSNPPSGTSFSGNNAISSSAQVISTGTISNSHYLIEGPSGRMNMGCHLMWIRPRDGVNVITAPSNTNVTISAGSAVLYSQANCMDSPSNSLSLTIPAGRSFVPFWIKSNTVQTLTLTPGGVTFNYNNLLNTSGTSNDTSGTYHSFVRTLDTFAPHECVPLEVRISKSNDSSAATINMTNAWFLALSHNNIGTFYEDANCTVVSSSRMEFNPSMGPAVRTLFYRRDVQIPPGYVASIFGSGGAALSVASNYVRSVGNTVYSGSGRWIAPYIEGGALKGIVYTPIYNSSSGTALSHSVAFLNITSSQLNIGLSLPVPSYSSTWIANAVGTSSYGAGFLNDDVAAVSTRFNMIKGVALTSDNHVLVSDYGNYRVRKIELFGSGFVRQGIGLGRLRERVNALAAEAYQAALAYPYKLEYLNNRIYFSELFNHRIRYIDLTTGLVSTVVGTGLGTVFSDGNDAVVENMFHPRGIKIVAWPNHLNPTHYVLLYAQPNQIRAVNLSSTSIHNFFGVTLLPGKVRTIVGDNSIASTGLGTAWGSNTEGMNAIGALIRMAFDVAFIKNELYFIDYNDSCMLRVTSNGKLYQVHPGTCGTLPTTTDGEFGDFSGGPPAAFRVRRPIAFGDDATALGNYFLLGDYDMSPGALIYINSFTGSTPTPDPMFDFMGFINVAVTAYRTANIARATRIYSIPSIGQARAQGIASWALSPGSYSSQDRLCWSTGEYDQQSASPFPSASSAGDHSIYCALRTVSGVPSLAAGMTFGAGGPVGFEQEGISRFYATFYGPTGLVFDDEGNLYIADSGNHIIRMIRRWW
ncbi:MAG: hypothetical protein NZ480_01330 [Bdellovibrionaceae bacterium]|nr:hypothetical protein [Pseudobdellovibrionaceae bacterium]